MASFLRPSRAWRTAHAQSSSKCACARAHLTALAWKRNLRGTHPGQNRGGAEIYEGFLHACFGHTLHYSFPSFQLCDPHASVRWIVTIFYSTIDFAESIEICNLTNCIEEWCTWSHLRPLSFPENLQRLPLSIRYWRKIKKTENS